MKKRRTFKVWNPNKKYFVLYHHLEHIRFFPEETIIMKLRFAVIGPVIVTGLYREVLAKNLPAINAGTFFLLHIVQQATEGNKK